MGAEALTPTTGSGAASGAVVVGTVRCADRRRGEGGERRRRQAYGGGRNETQLARLQSKIRWAIRWGCAGGREGRKVTRAQTPTKSIEDSTRHRSGVPDRASSSVTLCSSWQRVGLYPGRTSHVHLLCPPNRTEPSARSSANATIVVPGRERPVNRPSRTTFGIAGCRLINEGPLSRAPNPIHTSHLLTEPSRSSSLFEVFR